MSGKVIGVSGTAATGYSYTYDPADPESVGTNNLLTTGEEVYPRVGSNLGSQTMVSGQLRLTYFTARKSEAATGVRIYSGSVASATLTIGRIGLYLIGADLGGTLIAATANDTALLSGTITQYAKNFSTPTTKTAGQRYALGVLTVGTTAGSVYAYAAPPAEVAFAPRIGGSLSGQTDLPASFTEAGMGVSGFMPYGVITP